MTFKEATLYVQNKLRKGKGFFILIGKNALPRFYIEIKEYKTPNASELSYKVSKFECNNKYNRFIWTSYVHLDDRLDDYTDLILNTDKIAFYKTTATIDNDFLSKKYDTNENTFSQADALMYKSFYEINTNLTSL